MSFINQFTPFYAHFMKTTVSWHLHFTVTPCLCYNHHWPFWLLASDLGIKVATFVQFDSHFTPFILHFWSICGYLSEIQFHCKFTVHIFYHCPHISDQFMCTGDKYLAWSLKIRDSCVHILWYLQIFGDYLCANICMNIRLAHIYQDLVSKWIICKLFTVHCWPLCYSFMWNCTCCRSFVGNILFVSLNLQIFALYII